MSRFNKTYEYQEKLSSAKSLLFQKREKEAEKLLKECYEYFANEHIILKKLDTINLLIDLYLTLKDYDKVKLLLIEYESESKENGIEIPPEIFHSYGRYFSNTEDIKKSITNYQISIEKYLAKNKPLRAAISYLNLGEQLRNVGDFDNAAIAFITSRDIFLRYNELDLSLTPFIALTEMLMKWRGGGINIDLNNMEFVLENTNFIKSPTLAKTYINVGLIFQETSNYQKAIYYLKKAIEISKQINYQDTIYHAHLNLGYIFENLHDYSEAKNNFKLALAYYIKKRDTEFIALVYNGLALICRDEGNLDDSISYIYKSIEMSTNNVNFELNLRNHELLADLYNRQKDYENSIIFYSKILRIYNSLFEKSNLLGFKQIFREQFSRILGILKNLNELLKTQKFVIQPEILEQLEDNAVNICKSGSSKDILEDSQVSQLKEEVKKLKTEILELKTIINDKDKERLENNIIEDICKKIITYQAEQITPARIRNFLLKIPDPILRHDFLVKILSRVPNYYYTKETMYRKLKKIIENLPFDDGDMIIFAVMSETWNKSQNLWSYISERSISRNFKTEIMKTPQLFKFLSKIKDDKKYYVLFLDDVIGSGRQFMKYYRKDIEARTIKYPIKDKKNIEFCLVSGIISKEALEYISENSIFNIGSIKYDTIIKKKDKAFFGDNWENKERLSNLISFLKKMNPENWDGWKKNPDTEKGMEYLVVLDWRTPNNTIGILWNKTKEINPLFPR